MFRTVLRSVAVSAAIVAPLAAGSASASAPAAAPLAPQASSALDWLERELAANGNAMPGFGTTPDWGLTVDVLLAFASAGRIADPVAQATLDEVEDNAASFVSFTYAGVTVDDAGAAAKVLLSARSAGRSAVIGGRDYESLVRSMIEPSGPDTGRVSDRYAAPFTNGSNAFDQALAILGLELTAGGAPTEAVTFLLDQQCADGGFRVSYVTSGGCTDASSDTDATSLAVMALLAVDRTPEVEAALRRGINALVAAEAANGSTGAFGGTGPTSAINANSTGLAASALRAAGRTDVADRSAAWLTSCCQISASNSAGTTIIGSIGAIAYNPATLTDAQAHGISSSGTDQWRRSTAQAVLALGLDPYGPAPVATVVTPPSTTSSTTTSSTAVATTAPTPSSSIPATSISPSSTSPSTTSPTAAGSSSDPTTTAMADGFRPLNAVEVASASASAPTGSGTVRGTRLAATGTASAPLVSIGAAFTAVGAAILVIRRRELP